MNITWTLTVDLGREVYTGTDSDGRVVGWIVKSTYDPGWWLNNAAVPFDRHDRVTHVDTVAEGQAVIDSSLAAA